MPILTSSTRIGILNYSQDKSKAAGGRTAGGFLRGCNS